VHTSVNLVLTSQYAQLRDVMRDTLRAFPDALRALSAALHAMEVDGAKKITVPTASVTIEGAAQAVTSGDDAAAA
jgi:hypothetical protein